MNWSTKIVPSQGEGPQRHECQAILTLIQWTTQYSRNTYGNACNGFLLREWFIDPRVVIMTKKVKWKTFSCPGINQTLCQPSQAIHSLKHEEWAPFTLNIYKNMKFTHAVVNILPKILMTQMIHECSTASYHN